MTHYNETSKALIPYVPPTAISEKRQYKKTLFFDKITSFYTSRSLYYYCFVSLFIFISVFARCVHTAQPSVGADYFNEATAFIKTHGFGTGFVFKFLYRSMLCSALAFISGFTVFSLPCTVIASAHFFYNTSFVFFATVDFALKLSFLDCFFYISAFSLSVVASFIFFTETRLFYKRTKHAEDFKQKSVVYCFLFVLHLIISLGVSYFNYTTLLNS